MFNFKEKIEIVINIDFGYSRELDLCEEIIRILEKITKSKCPILRSTNEKELTEAADRLTSQHFFQHLRNRAPELQSIPDSFYRYGLRDSWQEHPYKNYLRLLIKNYPYGFKNYKNWSIVISLENYRRNRKFFNENKEYIRILEII